MSVRLGIIKEMINEMGAKNYDHAISHFTDDCEYTNIPMGTVRGPAAVRGLLEPFFAPTIRNEFDFIRFAVDDVCIFVERLDRHLLDTGWVELPVVGVFEFHDDKISVWRDYFDLATIMAKWPQQPA